MPGPENLTPDEHDPMPVSDEMLMQENADLRRRLEALEQLVEDSWATDDELLGEHCVHCFAKVRGHREPPYDPKNSEAEAVWVYECEHTDDCAYVALKRLAEVRK